MYRLSNICNAGARVFASRNINAENDYVYSIVCQLNVDAF